MEDTNTALGPSKQFALSVFLFNFVSFFAFLCVLVSSWFYFVDRNLVYGPCHRVLRHSFRSSSPRNVQATMRLFFCP